MKKIITALLALTLMLTAVVACSDNEDQSTDNSSANSTVSGTQSNTPSAEELTSEELDAWGNISIEIEAGVSSETVTTESKTESTESPESKTETTSSYDKDQGYGPWVPLP